MLLKKCAVLLLLLLNCGMAQELRKVLPERIPKGALKKGQFVGDSIAFHRNGMLALAGVFLKARLHGPLIYFDEKGSLEKAVFYVQGVKVSKEEYVKARAKYPELPPIPKSWKEWKKQIMRKCQAIVNGYRSMLPISLPPKL